MTGDPSRACSRCGSPGPAGRTPGQATGVGRPRAEPRRLHPVDDDRDLPHGQDRSRACGSSSRRPTASARSASTPPTATATPWSTRPTVDTSKVPSHCGRLTSGCDGGGHRPDRPAHRRPQGHLQRDPGRRCGLRLRRCDRLAGHRSHSGPCRRAAPGGGVHRGRLHLQRSEPGDRRPRPSTFDTAQLSSTRVPSRGPPRSGSRRSSTDATAARAGPAGQVHGLAQRRAACSPYTGTTDATAESRSAADGQTRPCRAGGPGFASCCALAGGTRTPRA